MEPKPELLEAKFNKSGQNRKTENAGLAVLLRDPRFQQLPLQTKKEVAGQIGVPSRFGTQAFDAVMTDSPAPPLTALNLASWLGSLHLIEMKTTRRAIDDRLSGFFFGVTARELELAELMGDRYLFAFVVLNRSNSFDSEFFVLLTAKELEERIRTKRVQYQVNLVSDWAGSRTRFGTGPVGHIGGRRAADPREPYE